MAPSRRNTAKHRGSGARQLCRSFDMDVRAVGHSRVAEVNQPCRHRSCTGAQRRHATRSDRRHNGPPEVIASVVVVVAANAGTPARSMQSTRHRSKLAFAKAERFKTKTKDTLGDSPFRFSTYCLIGVYIKVQNLNTKLFENTGRT